MSDEPRTSSTVLPLLAAGVVVGAVVALAVAARQRATGATGGGDAALEALDLQMRDELPWAYETSVMVHRGAGEIAVHIHDQGGLPGLVTPLDGPPLDRVDWTEPGGARLRFHVHTLPGGSRSEMTVKVAPPEGAATGGAASLGGLDGEVRSALVALRNAFERAH